MALARWMKRRAAIEPTIGHMKNDGRLGRNHLLGKLGDKLNVILCACGHNLRLILRRMRMKGGRQLIFALLGWLVGWLTRLSQRRDGHSMPYPELAGIGD